MIIEKLTSEMVEIMGLIKDPIFFAECLFTQNLQNHESLKNYKKDQFAKIRLYQLPFMSYEYLIADDPELSEEENFELKKGAGQCYMYCGRKIGKSLIGLLIDMCLDTIHNYKDWTVGFTSFDDEHVSKMMEPYIKVMQNHPFFKLFQVDVKRKNTIVVRTPTGHSVTGVNMNLSGREPGSYFESEHFSKLYGDEMHYETQEVVKKRSSATSEEGVIQRFAGITNFTPDSPAGTVFFDLDKRNWLVNAPQTVSKAWTPSRKEEAIKEHGDENAPSYRIHVMAEVIQDLEGTYDMDRIRACYYPKNKNRPVKHFELNQRDFDFKNLTELKSQLKTKLIVERPKNAAITYIGSDFGENITEIVILFEVDQTNIENKFRYVYSVSLYKMTPDEQTEIYKYLINKLQIEITCIDTSDSGGKQIYRNLNKTYKKENLEWVAFQEKIDIDYKRDDRGRIIKKDGKYEYEQEYVSDWSIAQIKDLFYNQKVDCLYDMKLDKEFGNMLSSPRLHGISKYKSKINCDHHHQAWQTVAIGIFKNKQTIKNKPNEAKAKWGIGVCS